jgi:hypothetical protein
MRPAARPLPLTHTSPHLGALQTYASSLWDEATRGCAFLDFSQWYEHYDGEYTINGAKTWADPPYGRSPNEVAGFYPYSCTTSAKALCEFSSSLFTCNPPPSPPPPPPRPPSPPSPNFQSCEWRGEPGSP